MSTDLVNGASGPQNLRSSSSRRTTCPVRSDRYLQQLEFALRQMQFRLSLERRALHEVDGQGPNLQRVRIEEGPAQHRSYACKEFA